MTLQIQLMGILFSLGMLYLAFLFYKKNNYSRTGFVLWALVWLAAIVLLLVPTALSSLASRLGLSSTLNLYVTLAMAFFAIVSFFTYVEVQRQSRKVEDLVRRLAIERPSSKGKKKTN